MADKTVKRIKLVFWVEDADTAEKLCETKEIMLEFDSRMLDLKVANTARRCPEELTEEQLYTLTVPVAWSWAGDIIEAGFLVSKMYLKNLCLNYLGYPTAGDLVEKDRSQKDAKL